MAIGLERRPNRPRDELVIADAEPFAGGRLAAGDSQCKFEELVTDFGHAASLGDLTGVQVHIFVEPLEQRRVAGDFDRGNRFTSVTTATTSCEQHQIGAAGDLAGDAGRVEPWTVHHAEPRGVDRLGIVIDGLERRAATFGDRTERLFGDRRQAAGFVADRRIVVDRAAVHGDVLLPPADPLEQAIGDRHIAASIDQQMLGAVEFGCLGEHGTSSAGDDPIGDHPDGRIGGDPRIAVGTATFEGQGQMRRIDGRPGRLVGLVEQRFDPLFGLGDRRSGATHLLHRHHRRGARAEQRSVVGGRDRHDLVSFGQVGGGRLLTAESDDQRRADIGMAGVAGEGPAEHFVFQRPVGEPATGGVGGGEDAVDVRPPPHPLLIELGRDHPADRGAAIDRRNQ